MHPALTCEKLFILHMQDGGQSVDKDAMLQSVHSVIEQNQKKVWLLFSVMGQWT